jgi:hypothetical protein
VTPRAETPTPDSTCRADSFSFPSCGNAASYGATTSRATDQSRPSKCLGTYIVCEKRLSLPFQLFYNFNLESFNSLDCSRICLKKTHSSTHLKIPFLYWILYQLSQARPFSPSTLNPSRRRSASDLHRSTPKFVRSSMYLCSILPQSTTFISSFNMAN